MKTKIIVVTGGVYSSLGKGIVASSIGCILKNGGYKIAMLKLDPYLNTDPGLLSPMQHGEVFITEDGQKTDLDLGHYERFTELNLTKASTQTGGKIYSEIFKDELNGKYNGNTIQVIPHLTNKIMEKIDFAIQSYKHPDFLIIEIGGTIGDIEGLPYIEATKLYNAKNKNILFIHCSPLFKLSANDEIKTKPTQHSIKNLRNLGINPHILVLRFSELIDDKDKEKLSWTCDVNPDDIFVSKDCKYLYEVPSVLYEQKIHESILKYFKIKSNKFDMSSWELFLKSIYKTKYRNARVCICGKYTELNDSYLSLIESLKIASYKTSVELQIDLINIDELNPSNYQNKLSKYNGIIIPDGELETENSNMNLILKYCDKNNKSYLGIKLGMKVMVEYFANMKKISKTPSIKFLDSNKEMLGLSKINLSQKSLAYSIYKKSRIQERHWNKWIINDELVKQLNELKISGTNVDNSIEILEYPKNSFFISTLFHPEYASKPNSPHPIFEKFIKSMI